MRIPQFKLRKSIFRRTDRTQWLLAVLSLVLLGASITAGQHVSHRHPSPGHLSLALLVVGAFTAVASGAFPLLLGALVLLTTLFCAGGAAIQGVGFLRHRTFSSIIVWAEYAMPAMILLWAVGGCLLSWGRRVARGFKGARSVRHVLKRQELTATAHMSRWGLLYAFALPVLTLLSIWAVPETPSAAGGYCALFGQLPWSDARGYFEGAHRWLDTGGLDDWNSRRPVNPAFLAVRLAVTGGNLHGALILQVLLLGVAVYLCARAIGSEMGVWAGLAAYALVWCWSRPYFVTTMTEALGVSLGALSFALLFKGMRRDSIPFLMLGLFGMAFAQASRMGALFMLPVLLAWVVWHYRDRGIGVLKYIGASLLVLALGFSINFILVHAYGNKELVSVGSNFAPTIHGLAANSPDAWAYYLQFEDLKQLPEAELNKRLYHDAWQMIRKDPRPLMHALWGYNVRPFFQNFADHVFSVFFLWDRNAFLLRTITWAIICLGLVFYFRRERKRGDLSFWIAGALGILLSVPIIYQNSGWRALAATYPWLACLLACGLSLSHTPKRGAASADGPAFQWWAAGLLLGVWVLTIFGPAVAARYSPRITIAASSGASTDEAVIDGGSTMRSTAVLVGTKPTRGVMAFDDNRVRSLLKNSGMEVRDDLDGKLPRAKPYMLAVVYDYVRKASIYLIAPPDLVNEDHAYIRLRLAPLNVVERSLGKDQYIFEVLGWTATN